MKDIEVYQKLLDLVPENSSISLWAAVELTQPGTISKQLKGNGMRVAQIRRIGESEKYPRIVYFVSNVTGGQSIFKRKG